ncbi:MAG: ABC transporter substrate-binding protein [Candidatus Riflebacteria bacterium]|nr:ABC transporter substrate-binding protein [Candidatus Riflebacteria bacterium]
MNNRCFWLFMFAFLFGILLPVSAEEKILKIGTLFPLTGSCALAGQRCKAAVETAVEIINNKHPEINVPLAAGEGVLGYKIQLVHADSQGKPDVGKSEAERLFDQENVYAIIGCYNSAVTKPASFVAERKKKIFVAGCSSSAALTERKMHYFFRLAPNDRIESKEFCDFVQWLNKNNSSNLKTLGLIYENTEFGKHAADEAKQIASKYEMEVVVDVPFNPGATNLNSEVTTLKDKNPDVIFGACLGGDYTLFIGTVNQQNWLPKVALNYCSGFQDPQISKQLGEKGYYFAGASGYSPDFVKIMPVAEAIEKLYKEKTGVPFDTDSILETVGMLVLGQAIEKAGTIDSEKVAETLHKEEFVSPLSFGGKVTFDEQGQNNKAMSVVVQLQNGEYRRVYPPEYSTASVTFPIPSWDKRK